MKPLDTMTPKVLAYALLGLIAVTELGLFLFEVPPANKDLFNNITQTVLTLLVAAVTFFVGSSSGSREKDQRNTGPSADQPPAAPGKT